MTDEVFSKVEGFFSGYQKRHYKKGQVLILNGQKVESVYYLLEGKVKEYDVTYRGDEITLNVFKPPAFFPMPLAISSEVSPYIFEAETNIDIRQAPATEVIKFIKSNPDVMFDLLSRVFVGMNGIMGRMAHLMSGSAQSRLIYELAVEAKRFGKKQPNGSITIAVSETDLSARAGLSRETVSREVHKLKQEGLIQIAPKIITIRKPDILSDKFDLEL